MDPNIIVTTIITGLIGSALGILSHWGVVRYKQDENAKKQEDNEKKIEILEGKVNTLNDKIINKHEDMERRFAAELSLLKNEVHQLRLSDERNAGRFALVEEKIVHIDKNIDILIKRSEK